MNESERKLVDELLTVIADLVAPLDHPDMREFRVERVEVCPEHAFIAHAGAPSGPRKHAQLGYSADRALVADAAALTLARRAQRLARFGKVPGGRDWLAELRQRFPRWFECEVSCLEGWADLLFAMAERIAEIDPAADFAFSQVKEKYGTLRAYSRAAGSGTEALIDAFEVVSGAICETCGAPGRLCRTLHGYFHTACPDHARGPVLSDGGDAEGWS